MRELQRQIIRELNVRPVIDPAGEIERRVGFLADYVSASHASGMVLGVSGGQDSSLAGRLCQLAVERAAADGRELRFLAVRLPYGAQSDEDDAALALRFIKPTQSLAFDIRPAVDALAQSHAEAAGRTLSDFTKGNVKARMRMVVQYALAGDPRLLVVGTDHAAEAVTGFFTKFGDGGADLTPLTGLTKGQGRALLECLGAPERLYLKTPTADLLDGQPGRSDEAELGLRYAEIDAYLEGDDIDPASAEALERRYLATQHKRHLPATPFDTWWRAGG